MTAMEEAPKKKPRKKAAHDVEGPTGTQIDGVLHVVAPPKPKPKPGEADYDWQLEYPGEEVFVFVPEGDGPYIGMTKLSPIRKPKPGRLRTLHREGGLSVMWYFIELVSSPNSLRLQEELDEDDYTKMLRAWAEFAGIELSE